MNEKQIRFIDSRYNELFKLPDGGYIQIDRPDDETLFRQCKFLDEAHVQVGMNVFHICEFAERMEKIGAKYAPVEQLEVVQRYTITEKTTVGKKIFVMAHNPNAVQPYVTWQGHTELPGYDWGHYFNNRSDAHSDYVRRAYAERNNRPYQPKKKDTHER